MDYIARSLIDKKILLRNVKREDVMGEAKRRRELDPDYGQKCRLVVSQETGKWLVQARVGKGWVSAAVYIDRSAALEALEQLKRLSAPYSPNQIPEVFSAIASQLPEDDDEVIYLVDGDGNLHDRSSKLVGDTNARLAEHGKLSDRLLEARAGVRR